LKPAFGPGLLANLARCRDLAFGCGRSSTSEADGTVGRDV
jgi:hypothetical protein